MAKLTAPCTGPSRSTWNPVSAYAAAPISSSQTKRLKRSPDMAKPHIAPRATSMSASKRRVASPMNVSE